MDDHRPNQKYAASNIDEEEVAGQGRASPIPEDEQPSAPTTRIVPSMPSVIIPAEGERPAVSIEAFDEAEPGSSETSITSGGKKYKGFSITSVKATVESMRNAGRSPNRSRSASNASLLSVEDAEPGLGSGGLGSGGGPFGKISPTARPPLAREDY